MFGKLMTLLGACAFLMIASMHHPATARDLNSGAEQPDQTFWLTIKDTSLPDLFEMFIKRYPKSAHRGAAERRLKALQGADQPSAMDQARQLMKKTPKQAAVAKPVVPAMAPTGAPTGAPATRAPALAAPVLAPAPALAAAPSLAPATLPSPRVTPSAAVAPSTTLAPATLAPAPIAPAAVAAPPRTAPAAPAAPAATVAEIPADDVDDQAVEDVSMETVILIQHHLNRVGCSVGNLDGKWGAKSQTSAARFAKTINQPLVTHSPNAELLATLKAHEKGTCAAVYRAKPRIKKYKRARTKPVIRKRKKSKKAKYRKKSAKKKVIASRKISKPKKAKRKKKVKKAAKIKVATKAKKAKKAKKVKKVYVVKRKKKSKGSGVSGDPFTDAVRNIGADSGSGGGGGGGWN